MSETGSISNLLSASQSMQDSKDAGAERDFDSHLFKKELKEGDAKGAVGVLEDMTKDGKFTDKEQRRDFIMENLYEFVAQESPRNGERTERSGKKMES